MQEDPLIPSSEKSAEVNAPIQPVIVVGSNNEVQSSHSAAAPIALPLTEGHRKFKIYLTLVFILLVSMLSLVVLMMLVPLVGVYMFMGLAPAYVVLGLVGLVHSLVVARSLKKKYFSGSFRRLEIVMLVLCVAAILVSIPAGSLTYSEFKFVSDGKKEDAYYAQQEATARSEATVEQATKLLQTCQVFGFYYTAQDGKDGAENAEATKTGILLYKMPKSYDGVTTPSSADEGKYRMHIADRMVVTMVPIARNAQRSCDIQFWHDGNYEQFKDGRWYFNGQVVQETGKTKEEAISLMQACKVDYFVGYTDINLVKESSTKGWLNEAERSGTGIAISEEPTRSYVFASKSMTAALQDAARQIRQACYGKKNLYITIDNWIETEYPAGKWTRVNR